MDRRLTPANDRVAAEHLRGQISVPAYSTGEMQRVTAPFADLNRSPEGPRDRQLLMGDRVTVYERRNGQAFAQAAKDGYVGYVAETALGNRPDPTHWIVVSASHAYTVPDLKSPEAGMLVFGDAVTVVNEQRKYMETAEGFYIPSPHLWPITKRFFDPVTVAQLHFGVPYLWGGNSTRGIDCSGLSQAALLAVGADCLGDSDQQQAALGQDLAPDAPLRRGDLLFWKGHCAMMVDAETIIHANAHTMSVAYEPVRHAIRRIETQGDGPVTARKRL